MKNAEENNKGSSSSALILRALRYSFGRGIQHPMWRKPLQGCPVAGDHSDSENAEKPCEIFGTQADSTRQLRHLDMATHTQAFAMQKHRADAITRRDSLKTGPH
ncbi:hypothetical protein KCU91_g125, partial [Aureobasidium melanogenum]